MQRRQKGHFVAVSGSRDACDTGAISGTCIGRPEVIQVTGAAQPSANPSGRATAAAADVTGVFGRRRG